ERSGLPRPSPRFEVEELRRGGWELVLKVAQEGEPYRFLTHLEVTAGGKRTLHTVEVSGAGEIRLALEARPTRVVFDALHEVPVAHPSFYTWANIIDDFDELAIVYGTARQIEANHTMARRWQERVADAYIEVLPPLVKDCEADADWVGAHDLIVMGTLADNYFFGHVPAEVPASFGRNHFSWRGESFGAPDDGLVLVLPNPWNSGRVMYVIAANSGMQLYRMTERYPREVPQWARFKGGEIVAKGYFERPGFVATFEE
ncbi:MAG: hypothetical protein MUE90_12200, partial [Thermoanaerobaculales bacterium]|nr:hypothetical protein [Thermoanaerobaculales bacterium]